LRYVSLLAAFVSAAQQKHDRLSASHEVDPVAWAEMYPQFAHALSNGRDVARVAERQAINSRDDLRFATLISQSCKPIFEGVRFPNFEQHVVSYRLRDKMSRANEGRFLQDCGALSGRRIFLVDAPAAAGAETEKRWGL
jgi:hypothetical protein